MGLHVHVGLVPMVRLFTSTLCWFCICFELHDCGLWGWWDQWAACFESTARPQRSTSPHNSHIYLSPDHRDVAIK